MREPSSERDLERIGEDLAAVLELAEHLPQRHSPRLEYPPFRSLVRDDALSDG